MAAIVIYHRADFDGIFCREIARKFLGKGADLIGWDYGDPEPVVSEEDELIILDLSVPGLMTHPNLVWIDHHKSAIEKYPSTIPGYRIDGVAACRLAWQWFSGFVNTFGNDIPIKEDYTERRVSEPLAVRLAGEYDVWDKRDPRAELFQHGLRSQDLDGVWPQILRNATKPTISEIESMMDVGHPLGLRPDGTMDDTVDTVEGLLRSGEVLQYAKGKENESIIKGCGFTVKWEGLTFLACNAAQYNSFLFVAGLQPEHNACLGFNYDGKKWKVSLYHAPGKESHDLSVIAVKMGGGGHRGACGFTCSTLPFSL